MITLSQFSKLYLHKKHFTFLHAVIFLFLVNSECVAQEKSRKSHLNTALEIYRYETNLSMESESFLQDSDQFENITRYVLKKGAYFVSTLEKKDEKDGPGVDLFDLPDGNDDSDQESNSFNNTAIEITKGKIKKELEAVDAFLIELKDPSPIGSLRVPDIKYLPHVNNYLEGQFVAEGTNAALASLFNISQQEIAKGIAEWALKRAQEELLRAYLQEWRDKLVDDELTGIVFPNTKNFMVTSDITTLITKGDAWKAAFQSDFDQLPSRTPEITGFALENYGSKLSESQKKEIQAGVDMASIIYQGLSERKKMDEIVLLIGENADLSKDSIMAAIDKTILLTNIIFNSISDRSLKKVNYYTADEIVNLNSRQLEIWWGVIYAKERERFKKIFGNDSADAELKFFKEVRKNVMYFKGKAAEVAVNYNHLVQLTAVDGLNSKKFDITVLSEYFSTSVKMIKSTVSLVGLLDPNMKSGDKKIFDDASRYIESSFTYLGGIQEGARTKNYGLVVTNSINFILWISEEIKNGAPDSNIEKLEITCESINKYGRFMIDIMNADSSEQVSKAIEDIAMKSGGFLVKQSSSWSLMLDLYPGIKYGREYLSSSPGQTSDDFKSNFIGVTLPIGFEAAKGLDKSFIGSVGIFIQLLDLGAVLNYSLNDNDSISSLPEFGFEQLLSPGGFITLHFRNNPIMLGIGANMTPELRNINNGEANIKANALQLGAFLAIDVAAIPFWTSREKIRHK